MKIGAATSCSFMSAQCLAPFASSVQRRRFRCVSKVVAARQWCVHGNSRRRPAAFITFRLATRAIRTNETRVESMGISPDTELREADDSFPIQSTIQIRKIQMNTSCLVAGLLTLVAGSACAQATIDHNKALAGGVTPGDAPGYPISITRPGHYKLMGNLSVPAGTQGIEIAADNVTLDLNGFTVAGPIECERDDATRAVNCGPLTNVMGVSHADGAHTGTTVRNGTVRGFGHGVRLFGRINVAQDLTVTHNRQIGLFAGHGRVERVIASLNGRYGVFSMGGVVSQVVATYNGNTGIHGNSIGHLQVIDSTAHGNAGWGLYHATVRGTVAFDNAVDDRAAVRSAGGNADGAGIF